MRILKGWGEELVSEKKEDSLQVMGARARAFALLLDCLAVAFLVRMTPIREMNGERLPGSLDELLSGTSWLGDAGETFCFFLGVLTLWGILFEAILRWTPGKRILGGRIVRRSGERAGWLRIVLRNILKTACLALLGIGQLWAFFDGERRAVYDRLLGTVVIRPAKSGK